MKKYLIAVLAVVILAAMAVPAYAVNYLEVKAQTQAKVGADSDTSLEPPVKAQVQAGDCTQDCTPDCVQDCTAEGDGEQVMFQFQQGLSEDKPVGYEYAGAREPGKGAGHHFSHKHALGTQEDAAE